MNAPPPGATLSWAHRWLGTALQLRVRSPETGRLVLVGDDPADEELHLGGVGAGTTDLTIDVSSAIPAVDDREARWRLLVRTATGQALEVVGEQRAAAGLEPLHLAMAGAAATVQMRAPEGAPVTLTVEPREPWGEVSEMIVDAARLRVTGRLIGHASEIGAAELAERDGHERLAATLELDEDRFAVEADLKAIPAGGQPRHWSLVLTSGTGDLRVAAHLDDVYNKGRAVVPDRFVVRSEAGWWTATPRFTDKNNVVVTTTEIERRGSGPPDPRERWEVDPRDLVEQDTDAVGVVRTPGVAGRLVRRTAVAIFDLLARYARRSTGAATRGAGDRRDVHFLIASIHATGGTIRATINTANTLAADTRNRVSLVVAYRIRKQQYFGLDPRVDMRILVNERWLKEQPQGGLRAWLRRRALRVPSAIIPRDDPRYYRFSLWHDVQLYRWLRSVEHGIIVTTRAGLSTVAARFARPGVRIVAQQHVPFTEQPPQLRDQLVASYRAVDAVTVLTSTDERAVNDSLAPPGPLVRRIPNGLYDVEPPLSPLTERRILCGGRMTPAKGIDLLIDAFSRIADECPEWELRIYGSARPDRLEAVREMVRQHGIADRVLLMAPTERLELEMSKASICAVPSRHEAFGMMIIEAMRCGLPVVSFDCPSGPREIIRDGIDGLLVPAEDTAAFADRLLKLIRDADLRRHLADQGLATAARYSPDALAQQWHELFEELHA